MKRPAFQFYPADWRKNAKLRRCSPAARGVWVDILCLLHDAEEYGVLRWPLKDIVRAAGASAAHVRELVEKGVFKGADHDAPAYVYRPTHAGKLGEPVILVTADGGPVWYCSRFVRDELIRQRRGSTTRFDTDNQPPSRPPKVGIGERQGDGPSSASSSAYSEPIGSAGAGAPPAVDKSTETQDQVEAKRRLWVDAGMWLVANRVTNADAKVFMNTLAKEYPKVVTQALTEAMQNEAPADAKGWAVSIAKRLAGERKAPVTKPSDAADKTADLLRQQAEHIARLEDPEAKARADAARREALAKLKPAEGVAA